MSQKTVLVTGGAGYIGSHVCKALAREGYTPVTFDNLERGHRELVKWGPLVVGDLRDAGAVEAAIIRYAPASAIHLAGFIAVGESMADPALYYDVNVTGSLVLLQALVKKGVKRVIFSSSAAVYGTPQATPLTEDHALNPINPYGVTKRMVEDMLKDFAGAYGLSSISLRYFNAAGADIDGESGEMHEPETHLIPRLLDVALGKSATATIHGTDYPTADGTCVRDYVHVNDLAQAHLLALKALTQGRMCTAYNLGYDRGYSVKEVIEKVKAVTGRKIPVTSGPPRAGDVPVLTADCSKARRGLDWTPQNSDIHTIVQTAWDWARRDENLGKNEPSLVH